MAFLKYSFPLAAGAALGCGLMAGLFFAFSVCVMKALGKLPPEQGIAAMQAINVTILNAGFFAVFFGTTLLCFACLAMAGLQWQSAAARFLVLGSLCYLVGVLLTTIVFNVPMNDALAAAKPANAEGQRLWADYLVRWTIWNHVRTLSASAAMTSFLLALRSV